MQASTRAIFALTGTNRFAPIQGKLVEITANELAPQGKSGELPDLQVNNLRVSAGKCPIQARAASTTATLPSADQGQGQLAVTSPATEPYADPGTVSQVPPKVNDPNIAGDRVLQVQAPETHQVRLNREGCLHQTASSELFSADRMTSWGSRFCHKLKRPGVLA